jgi:hypothetical protein
MPTPYIFVESVQLLMKGRDGKIQPSTAFIYKPNTMRKKVKKEKVSNDDGTEGLKLDCEECMICFANDMGVHHPPNRMLVG